VSLIPNISVQAAPDPNNHYMRAIQDQYNVQISFRQKQKNFHTTTCVVKVKYPPYTCVERDTLARKRISLFLLLWILKGQKRVKFEIQKFEIK
jgi:hypothetical protein